MISKRRAGRSGQINLDSLTDILANTVGIVIFILIFAVISARGAFFTKRFPILEPTEKQPVLVFCQNNTLMVCDLSDLVDQYLKPLDNVSYSRLPGIVEEMNQAKYDNGIVEITGDVSLSSHSDYWFSQRYIDRITVTIQPVAGVVPDTLDTIEYASERYDPGREEDPDPGLGLLVQGIHGIDKETQFFFFWVDTNSIDIFREARDLVKKAGFDTNWVPQEMLFWPIRFDLGDGSGGGGALGKLITQKQ